MRTLLRSWRHDTGGATSIEYAILAALVAVMAIAGLRAMTGGNDGIWGQVMTRIGGAIDTSLGE